MFLKTLPGGPREEQLPSLFLVSCLTAVWFLRAPTIQWSVFDDQREKPTWLCKCCESWWKCSESPQWDMAVRQACRPPECTLPCCSLSNCTTVGTPENGAAQQSLQCGPLQEHQPSHTHLPIRGRPRNKTWTEMRLLCSGANSSKVQLKG